MLYTVLKEQAKLLQLEIKKEHSRGGLEKMHLVYKETNLFQYLNGKNIFH